MNNSMLNKLLPISICLFLFGIFNLITPHNGEYGDQATENLFFLDTFDEYYSGDHKESYLDFIRDKNKYISAEYVSNGTWHDYGFENSARAPIALTWAPEIVKALPRMLHYMVYRALDRTFELNRVFLVTSYLIFFLTFFYTYRLGKILLDDKFAFIISGVFVGNLFFNQLLHASLEPQLNVYPVLLIMGMYSISKYYLGHSSSLIFSSLFLGSILGFGFLNGYPNTQLVLPTFLIGYLFITHINSRVTWVGGLYFLLLSAIFGVIIYSIFAIFYSISLGEGLTYHHKLSLIRFGVIFSGDAVSGSFEGSIFQMINETFGKIWILLSTGPRYVHAPHQPGMLLNLPFLNLMELPMFFIGIISTVFMKRMRTFRYFSIYLLVFFLFRAFSNDNMLVDKDSFDFYILLLFPVSFGMYYAIFGYKPLINKIVSIFVWISRKIIYIIFNFNFNISIFKDWFRVSKSSPFYISLLLILISSGINSHTFNNKFLLEYDASLAQFNGFFKVREFIKENASDSTLIIYTYSHGNVNSIYRLDFMREKRNLLLLKDIKNIFPTPEDMADSIRTGKYRNIIIIDRGANFRYGKRIENLGYSNKQAGTNRHYSFLNPSEVAYSYPGIPTYWIYNIDKNNLGAIVEVPTYSGSGSPEKISLNYNLNGRVLKGLDIPGNLSKISILCDGDEILSLDNNERSYDYIHVNTDGSYIATKYINWNNGFKGGIKPVSVNGRLIIDRSYVQRLGVLAPTFFVNEIGEKSSDISMNLKLNLAIDKVLLSTPYYLYNDFRKENQISISLSGIDTTGKVNEYYQQNIISDGSGLFGHWTLMNGDQGHESYDISMIELSGENEINLKYEAIGENNFRSIRSAVYSSFYGFERSVNYVIMYGHKPDLLGPCQGSLTFNAISESYKKVSELESYIGLTYSLN